MHKISTIFCLVLLMLLSNSTLWAGNPDRAGQAGATELLINPWAVSSGLHGMNTSIVKGTEAMRGNTAGLAFIDKTQITFASSKWLSGSGVNLNAFGFGQRIGESGVLGINLMSVSFGEIAVTTNDDPEGLSGATFRPQLLNISVGYAKSFSESIHVGFGITMVNESISDAKASGICMDMGIQYVTGKDNNIHFGIALRNIGTPMRFSGDGLSTKLNSAQGYLLTVDQRAEKFEMPSQLNIGAAYDILLKEKMHRITLMGNFTSNSFTKDFIGGGIEYSLKDMFMLRGGYRYEKGVTKTTLDPNERSSAFTGLSAGVGFNIPLKKEGSSKLGIDYSYRATSPYAGTHTLGVMINL